MRLQKDKSLYHKLATFTNTLPTPAPFNFGNFCVCCCNHPLKRNTTKTISSSPSSTTKSIQATEVSRTAKREDLEWKGIGVVSTLVIPMSFHVRSMSRGQIKLGMEVAVYWLAAGVLPNSLLSGRYFIITLLSSTSIRPGPLDFHLICSVLYEADLVAFSTSINTATYKVDFLLTK